MNFQEKLTELKQKNSEISRIKSEIQNISDNIFQDFRVYIFEKYAQLDSFGWTQYTPYFNDGDTCVFYANTDYIIINGNYAEDSDWFNKENVINWGQWNRELKIHEGRVQEPNAKYNEELVNAHNEIVEFLNNFDNDYYFTKFGDHAEIIVTKDRVDISDYDHD